MPLAPVRDLGTSLSCHRFRTLINRFVARKSVVNVVRSPLHSDPSNIIMVSDQDYCTVYGGAEALCIQTLSIFQTCVRLSNSSVAWRYHVAKKTNKRLIKFGWRDTAYSNIILHVLILYRQISTWVGLRGIQITRVNVIFFDNKVVINV